MSKLGDWTVRFCDNLNRLPSFLVCFLLVVTQAASIDYYLIHHLRLGMLFWVVGDFIVCMVFIACFYSTSNFEHDRKYMMVWITWIVMQSLTAAKVIHICTTFSTELDDEESSFFGPNFLKTSIALGSCIFVLLLTSQHDAPLASERRRYIDELTGTVVFDILDTADILEILFDEKERPLLSSGIPEIVLSVATLNLLLPTVPLITLSKTKFGLEKLQRKWIYLHRLLVVIAVNVPNLLLRMALWHLYSVAVSPFTLKNIILILMTFYEFYEHKKQKYEEHKREAIELVIKMIPESGQNSKGGEVGERDNIKKGGRGDAVMESDNKQCANSNSEETNDENDIHFDIEERVVSAL